MAGKGPVPNLEKILANLGIITPRAMKSLLIEEYEAKNSPKALETEEGLRKAREACTPLFVGRPGIGKASAAIQAGVEIAKRLGRIPVVLLMGYDETEVARKVPAKGILEAIEEAEQEGVITGEEAEQLRGILVKGEGFLISPGAAEARDLLLSLARKKKIFPVLALRLDLLEVGDLIGYPRVVKYKFVRGETTIFSTPWYIELLIAAKHGLLILDGFTQIVDPVMRRKADAIVRDRVVGFVALPPGVMVVALGNAKPLPSTTMGRLKMWKVRP